ncbi:hypothetical protein BMS3Abin15_00552 [bacterium BMS3Abin15]|nr:hypothetical protein BMS3Abin15_00552 [bacterium BMS3Abin15]HDZ85021.1 hypothetical protein [Candidatus Moranbacteria bacterium]
MEQEILKKLEEQEVKLQSIQVSIDKMRRYFFWTLIISIAVVVLPLIGIIAIIPWFLKVITSAYGGLM